MIITSISILPNKMKVVQLKMRETRFWPKMKFEPIFFQVFWQFFNPKGSLLRAGGKGMWSLPFRPPSLLMKSVRIFSNTHRQLVKVVSGSPSARVRQPIFGSKSNFAFVPQSGTPEAGFSEF